MAEGIISAFKIPTSENLVCCTAVSKDGSFITKLKQEPELLEGTDGGEGGKKSYTKFINGIVDLPALRKRARAVIAGSREAYARPAKPMANDIAKAAAVVLKSFISGAPMVVRFHGDGDGVAGAIALYRALNGVVESGICMERQVSWQVNKDVVYSKEAFYNDKLLFASYKSVERPLLVIIDFGTHIDSNDSIAMAEKTCEVVWIDHHTLPEGFDPGKRSIYINPFNFGSDSRLSAGLVASLMAQTIGAECRDLMEAALVSDHSACADYTNPQARKGALVVDYLITRRDSDSSSLRKIDSIMGDRSKLEEAYSKVGGMLEEAIAIGTQVMKKYRTSEGVSVYVIDFRKVKQGDYPPSGRFCSEMQYSLENSTGKPAITAVYYTNYISIRVSKSISDKVGLIGIIGSLTEETSGAISGGGHREAASIKAGSYSITEALNMFLEKLQVIR